MGGQGHPTPIHTPTHVQHSYTKSIENARFQLNHHVGLTNGPTDRQTDGLTYGQSLS